MMDHKEILELLPAYVDQELGLSDMLAVERHLASCADCQREYAEQRSVSVGLKKAAPYFEAPASLAQRISASLPQEQPNPTRRYRSWSFNWLNAGIATLSVLAIVWSAGLYLGLPSAQEQLTEEVVSSHVRSLQASHLADVASSDQHTVKPWFNGKLNFSPPVVDMAPQGFPLEGGRLDYLDGRPVAALVYRHNKHPINLFIWPSTSKDAAPRAQERQGYHLVHWVFGGMDYWAVSDLAANELDDFVKTVQSEVGK